MARTAPALLTTAALLLAAAPASAEFSAMQTIGFPQAERPAAAIDARGDALVAAAVDAGPAHQGVRVASRRGATGSWIRVQLGGTASAVRDVQTAVDPRGRMVVVWGHITRDDATSLRVAVAPEPRSLRTTQRLRVANAWNASPRLAVLRSGGLLLAYRSAGQVVVRVAQPGATTFGAPRVVGSHAAGLALATAGGGAVVAWTAPYRKGRPRPAYSRRLGGDGRPRERAYVITRDGGGTIRLGGSDDGRSIASWIRPGRGADRAPAAFTRSLRPVMRPARPLGGPGLNPRSPAALALRGDRGLAALGAFGESPFGFRVLAARSIAGGVWTGARELGAPSAMGGTPRPALLPDGTELVVWTTARNQVGPAVYDVLATSPTGTTSLGTTRANDGRGLVVAQAGSRVLAAWPADGGIAVSELG